MSDPLLTRMQELMGKYQGRTMPPPALPEEQGSQAVSETVDDSLPLLTDLVELGDQAPMASTADSPETEPASPLPATGTLTTKQLEHFARQMVQAVETRLQDDFRLLAHALVRQAVDDALNESLLLMQEEVATLIRSSLREVLREHGIDLKADRQQV